jgi:hypothetical protein
LNERLNPSIPFFVLSGDMGLLEVKNHVSRRHVVHLNPHKLNSFSKHVGFPGLFLAQIDTRFDPK